MPNMDDMRSLDQEAQQQRPRGGGALRRVRASWPFDWMDLVALSGLLLIGGSLALIWLPLAGLVVGALLIVYAFMAALPPRAG
jgi:hypothetical protein